MKKIHFISGMQRSGSSLLETLLNQNPDMFAAPSSALFKLYSRLITTYQEPENVQYNRDFHLNDVYKNIAQIFYARYNQNIIFDKNANWVSPYGIETIRNFIDIEPRIICPVRNVTDVLASWSHIIDSSELNKDNMLDAAVKETTFPDKPMPDRRADFLMKPDNDIYNIINWMAYASSSDNAKFIHFVDYDDLCENPQKELDKIYDFLGIKRFKNHYFTEIEDGRDISSQSIYGIKNLYKVHSTIQKDVTAEGILLPETIERCSGLEFWK